MFERTVHRTVFSNPLESRLGELGGAIWKDSRRYLPWPRSSHATWHLRGSLPVGEVRCSVAVPRQEKADLDNCGQGVPLSKHAHKLDLEHTKVTNEAGRPFAVLCERELALREDVADTGLPRHEVR
jgi:hypothetical protein